MNIIHTWLKEYNSFQASTLSDIRRKLSEAAHNLLNKIQNQYQNTRSNYFIKLPAQFLLPYQILPPPQLEYAHYFLDYFVYYSVNQTSPMGRPIETDVTKTNLSRTLATTKATQKLELNEISYIGILIYFYLIFSRQSLKWHQTFNPSNRHKKQPCGGLL